MTVERKSTSQEKTDFLDAGAEGSPLRCDRSTNARRIRFPDRLKCVLSYANTAFQIAWEAQRNLTLVASSTEEASVHPTMGTIRE